MIKPDVIIACEVLCAKFDRRAISESGGFVAFQHDRIPRHLALREGGLYLRQTYSFTDVEGCVSVDFPSDLFPDKILRRDGVCLRNEIFSFIMAHPKKVSNENVPAKFLTHYDRREHEPTEAFWRYHNHLQRTREVFRPDEKLELVLFNNMIAVNPNGKKTFLALSKFKNTFVFEQYAPIFRASEFYHTVRRVLGSGVSVLINSPRFKLPMLKSPVARDHTVSSSEDIFRMNEYNTGLFIEGVTTLDTLCINFGCLVLLSLSPKIK